MADQEPGAAVRYEADQPATTLFASCKYARAPTNAPEHVRAVRATLTRRSHLPMTVLGFTGSVTGAWCAR